MEITENIKRANVHVEDFALRCKIFDMNFPLYFGLHVFFIVTKVKNI